MFSLLELTVLYSETVCFNEENKPFAMLEQTITRLCIRQK